jgi:hypothetical protein
MFTACFFLEYSKIILMEMFYCFTVNNFVESLKITVYFSLSDSGLLCNFIHPLDILVKVTLAF